MTSLFATMKQVESMSEDDICRAIDGRLGENVTIHPNGWKAYCFLNSPIYNLLQKETVTLHVGTIKITADERR